MSRDMILPPVDQHGVVEQGYGTPMWLHHDQRVPRPVSTDSDASPLAAWRGDCDRHLFDVIDSCREREVEDDTAESGWVLEQQFAARLTCVHCGIIVAWEGTRSSETRDPAPVVPVPLVAGDLAAQMIDRSSGWGSRDYPTWAVHRGDERIGIISWSRGPRGREFFVGRLFAWADGEKVEAPTAAGVLKKLARPVPVADAGAVLAEKHIAQAKAHAGIGRA